MWLFISLFGVHYIIGATVAFIFATIFNYTLNRVWSFRGTKTEAFKSYFKFFALATINLGIIAGLLYILVEFFQIAPLIARIIAGIILFISNFLLNSIFIFKIFPHKKKT
jgi:dolichol-phosphate mannosyltransferase